MRGNHKLAVSSASDSESETFATRIGHFGASYHCNYNDPRAFAWLFYGEVYNKGRSLDLVAVRSLSSKLSQI